MKSLQAAYHAKDSEIERLKGELRDATASAVESSRLALVRDTQVSDLKQQVAELGHRGQPQGSG